MYCYKCGKYTETEETLCPECKEQQRQAQPQAVAIRQNASTQTTPIANTPSNKKGAVSMVLSLIASILAAIALGTDVIPVVIYATLGAAVCCIFALINGIKAIKAFVNAGKNNQKRPIAGFVMGLKGLEGVATLSFIFVIAAGLY